MTASRDRLEMIDWSERFPNETQMQTGLRQSTFCPCGKPKQIGQMTCGLSTHKLSPEVARIFDLN